MVNIQKLVAESLARKADPSEIISLIYRNINRDELDLIDKYAECSECRLAKTRACVIPFSGPITANLMVIGEAPGAEEDAKGVCFSGKTGTYLRQTLFKVGIDSSEILFTNSVACIPRDTIESTFRIPNQDEIEACHSRLKDVYNRASNLKLIVSAGRPGFAALNMLSCQPGAMTLATIMSSKFRVTDNLGWHLDLLDVPIYFIYHPSYICRQEHDRNLVQQWIDDLKCIRDYLLNSKISIRNNRVVKHYKEIGEDICQQVTSTS